MASYYPPILHNGSLNPVFNPQDYIVTNSDPYLPLAGGTVTGKLNVLNTTTLGGDFILNQSKIHLGLNSGLNQDLNSVAIGSDAGSINQSYDSFAMGVFAGNLNQGNNSVAVGASSGASNQKSNCVAIGPIAGTTTQGITDGVDEGFSVAIGFSAGQTNQKTNAIAIGNEAGVTNQGAYSIAIGTSSVGTGVDSIAIGKSATTNAGASSISIGNGANSTGSENIAIGNGANSGSGLVSIAIGKGAICAGGNTIAFGNGASTYTFTNAVAIGLSALSTADNQITLGTSNESVRIPGSLSWAQSAFISCGSGNVTGLVNATQTFTWTSGAGSLLGFSAVSLATTITIPYTGYYLMTFSTYTSAVGAVNSVCSFTATTTPETYVILRAGFPGASGFTQTLTGTRMIKFTAGNTIVMTGINSSSGAISIGDVNLQVVRLF